MTAKSHPKTTTSKKSPPKPPRKTGSTSTNRPTRSAVAATPTGSKLDQIQAALSTAGGATLAALMEMTGWQAHSVRGAMAGALKVKRKLTIGSEVRDGVRFYRIEAQQ